MNRLDRRQALIAGIAGAGLATSSVAFAAPALGKSASSTNFESPANSKRFRYCLNTSTIRGQKLSIDKIVDLAADAGYDGIEPWMGEINAYKESGGKLADLKKQIADSGLIVESAIGFANWIVDDKNKRAKALDQAKLDMEVIRAIGGERIAAPPAGQNQEMDLAKAAERYRALLEVGEKMGVVPQLELWGFSKSINRIGKLLYIASEAGHANACVLPDVYHIYKGGSDFSGLKMLSGQQVHVFHINDYPQIERQKIGDGDRVYPGDGVAPIKQVLNTMANNGFQGALSLELFNRDYWKQDAADVIKTGLAKMKKVVQNAFAE